MDNLNPLIHNSTQRTSPNQNPQKNKTSQQSITKYTPSAPNSVLIPRYIRALNEHRSISRQRLHYERLTRVSLWTSVYARDKSNWASNRRYLQQPTGQQRLSRDWFWEGREDVGERDRDSRGMCPVASWHSYACGRLFEGDFPTSVSLRWVCWVGERFCGIFRVGNYMVVSKCCLVKYKI